ncbi:MAG: DUF1932 domain-containing protein [Streptosporangiales bacterium]|nr:DUF1932 domain-containing protein [Streptosporangiales bacterium]
MRCAVIGLGEAGAKYAAALAAAGHSVTGIDPKPVETPPGVTRVDSLPEALAGAEAVLVLTESAAAPGVARDARELLAAGACYADFTSSSPATMAELGELISKAGARFVDVAILGPMPVAGARTALMVAGPGSGTVLALGDDIGAPVEETPGGPGAAMGHKLLRSVFMKGLAAIVVEATEAGRAAGYEEWVREQIAAELADGRGAIDRLVVGTANHAARRAHEMDSATGYLADLGVPNEMCEATTRSLSRIATTP